MYAGVLVCTVKMEESLEVFYDYAEAVIHHLKSIYDGCDEDTLEDCLELVEHVLQWYTILIADHDEDELFLSLRYLVAALLSDKENRARR